MAKSLGVDELGKCSKDDIVARTVDRDAMEVSVGRTIMGWSPMWIEQAGKGSRRLEVLIRFDSERTPAEIHLLLSEFLVRPSGVRSGSPLNPRYSFILSKGIVSAESYFSFSPWL